LESILCCPISCCMSPVTLGRHCLIYFFWHTCNVPSNTHTHLCIRHGVQTSLSQWEVTGQNSTCQTCDFLAGIFCDAICIAYTWPVKERRIRTFLLSRSGDSLPTLNPYLSLVDMLHTTGGRFGYVVIPFPPSGPPLLSCLLAWTLVLAPCFFFSPFLGCFPFFYKGWQGFINTLKKFCECFM
jgi:hypothetical protein